MEIENVKKNLEGWRMVLLPLNSVLLWDKHWYPLAIIGCVSAFYFIFWLLDLPTLTTLAVTGLLLNLIDFMVIKLSSYFFKSKLWTGHEEKMFEDICYNVVYHCNIFLAKMRVFYSLRGSHPSLYFGLSICMSLLFVWISSAVNNILLFYILTTTLLLWPGLQQTYIFKILNFNSKGRKAD